MNEDPKPNNADTTTPIPSISTEQKETVMEVHTHGHVHEKVKWKEYVFQFFMLLLAVFLGSFAETKREELVERHKEADYIESMIQDIRKDTAEINSKSSFIFEQIKKIDTIQLLFIQGGKDYAIVRKSYELSRYLFWYAQAVFNERTFSQLIGSGNMRLIKKTGAADKIMEYYNAIKGIDQQKQQYVAYINLTLGNIYKVYDYSYLTQQMDEKDSVLKYYSLDNYPDLHFRTTDPAAFTDLGGTLENTKQVIFNYMQQLKLIGQSARELILFLREKYDIKE